MKTFYLIIILLATLFVKSYSQEIWSSDFSNPGDWKIKSSDTSGVTWQIGTYTNSGMGEFYSTTASNGYALYNSDAGFSEENAEIYTNNFIKVDTGLSLYIKFQQYYERWSSTEYMAVMVYSKNADSTYYIPVDSLVQKYHKTANPDSVELNISGYITSDDSIKLGFYYYDPSGNNWAWYIDDVSLYYKKPIKDAKVDSILTSSKMSISYENSHIIKAAIINSGNMALNNLPVKLEITGANIFTNTQTITLLKPGDSTTVVFDNFSPFKLGIDSIKISVPDDSVNNNNSLTMQQEIIDVPFFSDFSNPADWHEWDGSNSVSSWKIGQYTEYIMGKFNSTTAYNNYAVYNSDWNQGIKNSAIYTMNYISVKAGLPLNLKFEQYYYNGDPGEYLAVIVYSKNTGSWNYIQVNSSYSYTETANPDTLDVPIGNYITSDDSILVGFYFYDSNDVSNWAWYVDDVVLYYPKQSVDAKVVNISALGKLPLHYGTPYKIRSNVTNVGNVPITKLPVKLEITGNDTFTNVKTVSQLNPGDTALITFDGFSPVKLGLVNIKVSVPDDSVKNNDSINFRQEVTYNTYNFADTSAAINSLGISSGSGMTLVKYHINIPKTIGKINVYLCNSKSIAKTVYAVLLDSTGNLISHSDNYVIQTSDLNKYHQFNLDSFPVLNNTDFYVGLAQLEAGIAYWPVGAQAETGPTIEGYYWAGDLIPSAINHSMKYSLRPMIEAVVGDPPPSICVVSASMENGRNNIVWERKYSGSIQKYNIYREGNEIGVYDLIGTVNYNDLSVYEDTVAVTDQQQYLYKITSVDTMGNESDKSPYHKTLLLQFNSGTKQLIWQEYKIENRTNEFKSYVIYRSSDSIHFDSIATLSGDLLAYNDKDVEASIYRRWYRIGGLLYNPCNPVDIQSLKAGGNIYTQSVSNMEDNRLRATKIDELGTDQIKLKVYPNPYKTQLTIGYNLPGAMNVSIDIFDIMGSKVAVLVNGMQQAGPHNYYLSSENYDLSCGVYFLKFKTDNGLITTKLVKTN